MQVRILCVDCPLRDKKIALLATNAFRITAPTKYLSSIFFEYIVERTDIPPNPTHRKIRFGLYIILVRQRKKIKKKSLKKWKNTALFLHLSIYPCTLLYTIALYSRNFVRSKHLAVFLNRFSKETRKRTSLEATQCYKIWEKLCNNVCFGNIYCIVGISVNCTVLSKKNLRALCCDEQACLQYNTMKTSSCIQNYYIY